MKAFDAHSDIWTDITIRRFRGEKDVFRNHHFERLRNGGVEGSIFVIWVDPPHTRDYGRRTKEIFSCISDEAAGSKDFRIVKNYGEMMKAREEGVFYIMIGVEGMTYASYDPTFARLDEYYDCGARHGMLTWNEENGFDFCGFLGDPDDPEAYSCMDAVTPGLEDAGMIPSLIGIFRQRGMKDEEIGKIAYGNFHRIIKEAVG